MSYLASKSQGLSDRLERLEIAKPVSSSDSNTLSCYDCKKSISYQSAKSVHGRHYCPGCICGSCRAPFDRAPRSEVTLEDKSKLILCDGCFCAKCTKPILPGAEFIEVTTGLLKSKRACPTCVCEVCGDGLVENVTNGQRHCKDCLCSKCGSSLAVDGYTEHKGQRLCIVCAGSEGASGPTVKGKCPKCKDDLWGDLISFGGQSYHADCFVCTGCQVRFGTGKIFLQEDIPYCSQECAREHSNNLADMPKCVMCKQPLETGLEIDGKYYHEDCFACKQCNKSLQNAMVLFLEGFPHCEGCGKQIQQEKQRQLQQQRQQQQQQQQKVFEGNCDGCGEPLGTDLVQGLDMTTKFHRKCFNCAECKKSLSTPGTEVYISGDKRSAICGTCLDILSQ